MRKLFTPLAILTALTFAYSPVMIASAPYESTMGLVQKIFYYHAPSWFAMFTGVFVCGIASAMFLFRRNPAADRVANSAAELAVVFGLIGLVTGPLWARKAWGVWWKWDARLTMALLVEMIRNPLACVLQAATDRKAFATYGDDRSVRVVHGPIMPLGRDLRYR